MQFLILLIGVLVFVFYQFRPAPMIFNEVEALRAADAEPAAYAALEFEVNALHEARQQAALAYIDTRDTVARDTYVAADVAYKDKRNESIGFVRDTNDNPTFNDVNYVFRHSCSAICRLVPSV